MADKFNFQKLGDPVELDWPVTVSEPVSGGQTKVSKFVGRFHLLSEEEKKALDASGSSDPWAWFRATFVGLGEGEGELTEAIFLLCMSRAWTRNAIARAYFEAEAGGPAKN